MRSRVALLGLALAALTASCSSGVPAADTGTDSGGSDWKVPCDQEQTSATAADFEEFTLECLSDGADYELGGLDDRPRVITVWAAWCGPCRNEAPAFKKFHERYGDQVELVGVDSQDDPKAGRAFAADAGWEFPSVIDSKGAVMRSRGVTTLPVTFFVDAKGKTVATFNETELTIKELEQAAAEHFGVRP